MNKDVEASSWVAMDASNSLLGRPKTNEKYHIYKLFEQEQSGSINDHCDTIEDLSEEDVWDGIKYYAEAMQAGLQENESDVVADSRSVGIKEGNIHNSSIYMKIVKKVACHEENNGTRTSNQSSAPVNILKWSQMVCKLKNNENFGGYGIVDRDFERIQPHELIARLLGQSEIASFSVYEGAGRTLKSRDLIQVRNAIWTRTGFLK